jgi:hypothetical protein
MRIKNGVPGQTRDAAAAEAVWGSPGLENRLGVKTNCNRVEMKLTKNDTMNIGQLPQNHHAFINPVGELEQKRIATGSYAGAANLARCSPQNGQLTWRCFIRS